MPGHDWTPDGKSVLFWREGHLWKVDVATNAVTQIPFTARYQRTVSELVKPKLDAANAVNFTARLYHVARFVARQAHPGVRRHRPAVAQGHGGRRGNAADRR